MKQLFCNCNNLVTLDIRKSTFTNVTSYDYFFYSDSKLTTIYVKDTTAQSWVNSRLSEASKTGVTVTIA